MSGRGRIAFLAAVLLIVVGSGTVLPGVGHANDRLRSVMGIVERVSGTDVSVGGKSYDLKDVPIRSAQGGGPVDAASLRGTTVEIVFRNGKLDSVMVYRTLPQ